VAVRELADLPTQRARALAELAARRALLAALGGQRRLVLEPHHALVPLSREQRVVLVIAGLGARSLETAPATHAGRDRDRDRDRRATDPRRTHRRRCYKHRRCAPTSPRLWSSGSPGSP